MSPEGGDEGTSTVTVCALDTKEQSGHSRNRVPLDLIHALGTTGYSLSTAKYLHTETKGTDVFFFPTPQVQYIEGSACKHAASRQAIKQRASIPIGRPCRDHLAPPNQPCCTAPESPPDNPVPRSALQREPSSGNWQLSGRRRAQREVRLALGCNHSSCAHTTIPVRRPLSYVTCHRLDRLSAHRTIRDCTGRTSKLFDNSIIPIVWCDHLINLLNLLHRPRP